MSEYTVSVFSAMRGDAIPLRHVAEAMATHAATGYGTLPLHGPTLENKRISIASLLLHDANRGTLPVCDAKGRGFAAQEIIDAAQIPAAWMDGDAEARNILALYVLEKHLIEWGRSRGDVFNIVEVGSPPVEVYAVDDKGDSVSILRGFAEGSGVVIHVLAPEASEQAAPENGASIADPETPGKVGPSVTVATPAETPNRSGANKAFVEALKKLLNQIESAVKARGGTIDFMAMPGKCANLHDLACKNKKYFPTLTLSTFKKYQKTSGLCSFPIHSADSSFYKELFPDLFK